ncbi:MAG: hypothetical protein IJR26_06280 [Bacteroidales bacterium]|nr:hypothetical protein [Bacteroidales bacterium]
MIQSDGYNKKNKNDCVYATWYAGVLACDLNTNVFTMCLVALPLWLLYEFSIIVASKAEPKEEVSTI